MSESGEVIKQGSSAYLSEEGDPEYMCFYEDCPGNFRRVSDDRKGRAFKTTLLEEILRGPPLLPSLFLLKGSGPFSGLVLIRRKDVKETSSVSVSPWQEPRPSTLDGRV